MIPKNFSCSNDGQLRIARAKKTPAYAEADYLHEAFRVVRLRAGRLVIGCISSSLSRTGRSGSRSSRDVIFDRLIPFGIVAW